MSTVILLTALDLEFQAVRRHLQQTRTRAHPAGTLFETGQLTDAPGSVCLGVTGEGNLSAAIVAERAIAVFRPAALICVGVAGSLRSDIALGDIVVGTKIYAFHSGREIDDEFLARPRAWHASHELEQFARQTARTGNWTRLIHGPANPKPTASRPPAVHFKPIASGEVLLTATGTPLNALLRSTYDDAAAIEMESAGIAHAAHLNRSLPTLSVRGISDNANSLKHAADKAGWQHAAADRAAAFSVWLAALILRLQITGTTPPASNPAHGSTSSTVHQRLRHGGPTRHKHHPAG